MAAVGPASIFHHIVSGQHISACITCDGSRQPLSIRVGTDEDEKAAAVVSAYSVTRALANIDRRQVSVTVDRLNFRPQLDHYVRFSAQLIGQILRHALFEGITSYNERHLACIVGKVQCRLTGRIPGTDEVQVKTTGGTGLAARRTVVDTLTDEPIEALNRKSTPCDASGEDQCTCPDEVVPSSRISRVVGSMRVTQRVTRISAPSRFACRSARLASSSPETPPGNPR